MTKVLHSDFSMPSDELLIDVSEKRRFSRKRNNEKTIMPNINFSPTAFAMISTCPSFIDCSLMNEQRRRFQHQVLQNLGFYLGGVGQRNGEASGSPAASRPRLIANIVKT